MRKIIHIDMDAFFASVEMRDNPKLEHLPIAVGGSNDRRGVLCTANYVARKFGVKSAMPSSLALKLCPDLILIKPNFKKYSQASKAVFEIFSKYTHLVEPMSLDEAYLDVTGTDQCSNSATLIAKEIREQIKLMTGLNASAGISCNKLIAKLASDYKKPNGQFTVCPSEIDSFIRTIPIERIWGIGKVTAKKMHEMGIKNCLDLQAYERNELSVYFGKFGENLYDFCRGIDYRKIETEYERKSLGTEETYIHDLATLDEMKIQILELAHGLKSDLKHYQDRAIKNIQVKIKYFDFKQTTIERDLPLADESFLSLLEERWSLSPMPVRLLGVGVKFAQSTERTSPSGQLCLF